MLGLSGSAYASTHTYRGYRIWDWYTVESVPNELAGNILQSVLKEDGIPAYLRCHEVPYYGGVKGNLGQSEWGDVLVPVELLPQARECLKVYFDSLQDG